jgi:DNA uptake protein ComE-like DNA-binding protein
MKKGAVLVVLAGMAMAAAGCVSSSKYEAAVAESQVAKTDLEKIRAQKSSLEQQVKSLKELNGKLSADAEFISAELQRIKEGREKERAAAEGRVRDLEDKMKDLTAQHRTLRHEYEAAKKQNENLKSTVARYQKELKERERAAAAPPKPSAPVPGATSQMSPPPASSTVPGAPPRPAAATPAPAPGAPKPAVPPVATAPAPSGPPAGLTPVNINTASASDMVLFLGLSKDVAERVIANRPYRIKGEMVAKNVVPKATFDAIKDRITAGP